MDFALIFNAVLMLMGSAAVATGLNVWASRRTVNVNADVTTSTDTRKWVEMLMEQMQKTIDDAKAELALLRLQFADLEKALAGERDRRIESDRKLMAAEATIHNLEVTVEALRAQLAKYETQQPPMPTNGGTK